MQTLLLLKYLKEYILICKLNFGGEMMKDDILSLVNEETFYMIDIDGVCIDTEERIAALALEVGGFKEAFKVVDWHEHIFSSEQINGSLDILREVQKNLKRIQLLTQNHTFDEAKEKVLFFRENGIYVPIISVPSKVRKSEIVVPSFYDGNVVLVDDKEKYVNDWNNSGGIGVLFSEDEQDVGLRKVKSLDFLRRIK